jgi:uncharacterized protein
MIKDSCIPKIPKDLIEGQIEGYSYFLNPRGHHGVLVFFWDTLDVFRSCKKGLSFQEMKSIIPWAQTNPQRLEEIIATLGRLEMLNLGKTFSERLRIERQQSKKKRMMVWLQLTDACNLSCGYCYIKKQSTRMGLELAKRLIAKVTSDCRKAEFDEVVFKFAGGEPTLCWTEGKALIDWAKTHFAKSIPQVRFHIITNATLLPSSLIEYASSGKICISVSLDGVEEWHDKQRRYQNDSGSFRDVDSNLNKLLSVGIRPYILTTVTKDNVCGITELAEYCIQRELGFRFSFYRDVPSSPDNLKNDNLQLTQELLKCYEWIANNLPARSLYQSHKFGDTNLKVPKIRSCGIGVNGMTLTSNGEVCVCQYKMSEPIGNAFENNTVQLIMNQDHYRLDENRVEQIPVCKDCKWRFVCGGGCPFLTKRHYGTFKHHSPYCEVYKSVLPVLVELHALQLIRKFKKKGGE